MWRRLARRRRSRGRRSCWGRTGPAAPSSPARRGKGRTCGERPGRGGGRASVTAGPPALRGRLGSPAAGGAAGLGRAGAERAPRSGRAGPWGGRARAPLTGAGSGRGAGSAGRREPRSRVRPRHWEGTAACGAGAALSARGPAGWGLGGCSACFRVLNLLKTAVTEEKCVSEMQ